MTETGAAHLGVFLKSTEVNSKVLPVAHTSTTKFTLILLHHQQPEKSIRKGEHVGALRLRGSDQIRKGEHVRALLLRGSDRIPLLEDRSITGSKRAASTTVW